MNVLWELLDRGGYLMVPLVLLSVVLYVRCFGLYFTMRSAHRRLRRAALSDFGSLVGVRTLRAELSEAFEQQRFVITTLIAAAPLLGLLGTVTGMIGTFESLVERSGQRSFEGLAEGISMALITTETGLAIAIPAVILLHFAQRHVQHGEQTLVQAETQLMEVAP